MDEVRPGSARRVLAIGTTTNLSMSPEDALAADGTLIVIESDAARADEARRRIAAAGLDGRATVITSDPRRMLYKLAGPFDAIFCDSADPCLHETISRLLAPDGVLVAR